MGADFSKLIEKTIESGAFKAAVIPVSKIETDVYFRDLCKANYCGNYGRNWMCPPFVGDITELISKLGDFEWALVYQTVGELEDSYDFEGMMAAAKRHNQLVLKTRELVSGMGDYSRVLSLGTGGCNICTVCAKRNDEPCRHPESAVSSLEAYGINVSRLSEAAGMKYINGQDTVTYFGAVLFG